MVGELSQAESAADADIAPINYTGSGRSALAKGKSKMKFGKISAGSFVGLLIAMIAVGVALIGAPVFMIGALDYNLQESLGFSDTVAILEKQGEYITGEMLSLGKVPAGYASDLGAAGITVGQVTAKGDFVPTNEYIADIDRLDDIAAISSGFIAHGASGELAVLFEGELVEASDFVAAVEANPRMYAAYSNGANLSAKFYYSDDVEKVYNDMGLKRYSYAEWESTGDPAADEESFNEILKSILDSETSVAGGYDCGDGGCNEGANFKSDNADEIIDSVGGDESGAELLNSAISSEEPYRAASAFMAIEEPIQRTRIDGDGPANEVMNTLNTRLKVTYTDVLSGEETSTESSILDTPNFAAAVSGGNYSMNEAANFSRDRVLNVTGIDNPSLINDTALSSDGRKQADLAVGSAGGSVDIGKATSSASIGLAESNSSLFTSVVGGNRIVEGGAFISTKINMRTLGAMPSDEDSVIAYSHDVNEAVARKAAADRATKSPFDISSPHTFMGSIVHGLAVSMLRTGGSNPASAIGAVANYTGESVAQAFDSANADGNDGSYLTTFGDHCKTPGTVGSAADIYCTNKATIYTGYMSRTADDWGEMGDDYKDEFVLSGMDRWATAGVQDAGVCKKYKDEHSLLIEKLFDEITKFFGVYDECRGVDDDIATGEKFVLNSGNSMVKKYSGYTLYNVVSSLLSEEQSEASKIIEKYYAEHPMDNSRAGILARRSGMTKDEATRALAFGDYLAMIASYDPTTRYNFVAHEDYGRLAIHSSKTSEELYCVFREEFSDGDPRNRNFAA